MRRTFYRWVILLMLLILLAGIPIEPVSADLGVILLDDGYPTSEGIAQDSGHMEKSVGLIFGAMLIAAVIFGGVIFRRVKS